MRLKSRLKMRLMRLMRLKSRLKMRLKVRLTLKLGPNASNPPLHLCPARGSGPVTLSMEHRRWQLTVPLVGEA